MGFYSFRQQDHTPKLMVPPKGMTKWKTKFFYIKAAAITTKIQFKNVTDPIITENISIPRADMVDWFLDLRIIGWVRHDEQESKANVLSEDAPLRRMFFPNFKGKVAVVACEDGEEGSTAPSVTISGCLNGTHWRWCCRKAKDLGALGDPSAAGIPKQPVQKMGDKRFRKPKKPHEPVVIPPLVPEVAGISRTRLRKYDDYVVVSDTLEGLGVLGGAAAAGGSSVGVKPVDDKKRKGDAPLADEQEAPYLRRTRGTAIPKATPAVTTETREEPVHLFAIPPSSPKAVGVEVQKEDRRNPSIEMVTPPSVRAEDTAKKPAVEIIADRLDSSNNLIDPHAAEGQGVRN
ncbi:hypothetical protein Hanom_Chr13g01213221 [Helianthus anomalus]